MSSIKPALLTLLLGVSPALTASDALNTGCQNYNPQRTAFYGDTHIHSKYSLDASTKDTRTTPTQVYEFAKGQKLGVQPWSEDGKAQRFIQLDRPLDFAMVSDHSELLGEVEICSNPEAAGYDSWQCFTQRLVPNASYYLFNIYGNSMGKRLGFCGEDGENCRQAAAAPWKVLQDAAHENYEPCHFTTFVGYEWSGAPEGQNLHRNVLFKNDKVPSLPVSYVDSGSPEKLYQKLNEECREGIEGCEVLAIPHNPNLSNGLMFNTVKNDGKPLTKEELSLRASYEKLIEIMQHKGSSECYFNQGAPLSNADELCNFEQLPYSDFKQQNYTFMRKLPTAKTGFVREALKDGLTLEQQLGENPFKFGIIASTDTHLGAPGMVQEEGFREHGAGRPGTQDGQVGLPDNLEFNPGGLAAVWAEENTRKSIFEAIERRETFGTSGPRISVRFFGGYDYSENLCESHDFVEEGYKQGVPMGSDLPASAKGKVPVFAVSAMKDPGTQKKAGVDLQRIQVVKGWVDEKGVTQEKIFEVAGKADNGASVDLSICEPKGTGFEKLCSVWKDPEFNPEQSAFYYTRVVENPSCRWSQYICSANKVDCSNPETIREGLEGCCMPDHQPVIQERAWSSPIWYSPAT